jgi:hypothetical protein
MILFSFGKSEEPNRNLILIAGAGHAKALNGCSKEG